MLAELFNHMPPVQHIYLLLSWLFVEQNIDKTCFFDDILLRTTSKRNIWHLKLPISKSQFPTQT